MAEYQKVRENKATGHRYVTVPKSAGIDPGTYVKIEEVEEE